ncbi:hypothetical protein REPUB_Repub05bG0115000 [Reevesia pubescens]
MKLEKGPKQTLPFLDELKVCDSFASTGAKDGALDRDKGTNSTSINGETQFVLCSNFAMENQFQLFPFFLTFILFIFLVFKLWMKSQIRDSPNLPPSPWKLPLIGHLHLLIFSLPHHRLRDLSKKHGSLMHLKLGELSNIVVSSPETAREVMKTHDINFANRPFLLAARIILYNFTDITYAQYGGYWRQLRKICTLELLSTKRVESFRSIREEEVSNLIRSISSNYIDLPINLGDMLRNISYSITLRTAFAGRSCKKHEAFVSLIRKISEDGTGFSITDLFPSFKFLDVISGMRAKLERLHHDLDGMLESIIEEHRASTANPKNSDENVTEDLVDVLLNIQDHGDLEFPLTNDNIKAVILDILVAGTGTAATTVEWAMSEMMKNPRMLEKAQAEVRQITPSCAFASSKRKCEINGYEIPARSKVIVNAWAIGRDPNYWNEAERFNPERFLDSSIDYKGANFEFIPFGAGRRICPGISFGMAIVELSLANLLYHFDWKLPNGMKPEDVDMSEAFGVAVRRKKDLYLIPIPYYPPIPCVHGR